MHTHTHIITQISTNFLHSYSKHCSTQNLLQNTLYRIEHTNLLQVVNCFSPDLHFETVNTRRKKKKTSDGGEGGRGLCCFLSTSTESITAQDRNRPHTRLFLRNDEFCLQGQFPDCEPSSTSDGTPFRAGVARKTRQTRVRLLAANLQTGSRAA